MAHTFRVHFYHFVWSTKSRSAFITNEIESRLYDYIGAIVEQRKAKLMEIGGMTDHIHLLIKFTFDDKIGDLIREIKAGTSLWIHKNFPELRDFA